MYLARFTETGHKHSKLHVIDLRQRKTYATRPINVCVQRDFNKVVSPDLAEDALEAALSKVESVIRPALDEVSRTRRTGRTRAWVTVVNLMALVGTRNPSTRARAEQFYTEAMLKKYESETDTPEKFAALMAEAKAAGNVRKDIEADFEKHRVFLASRRFTMSFTPGFHVPGEFQGVDRMIRRLMERRWMLLEAEEDTCGFVTTDRPLTLFKSDGSQIKPGENLGLATPGTSVLFPLSPKLVALGTHNMNEGVTGLSRALVAKTNLTLIRYCESLVLSPHERFEVAVPGREEPVIGSDVLDIIGGRVE